MTSNYNHYEAIHALIGELQRLDRAEAHEIDDAVRYGSVSTEIFLPVRSILERLDAESLPLRTARLIDELLARLHKDLD